MAEIKYKLRKDDLVEVIAGKDKGKKGKIIKIDTSKGRVIVTASIIDLRNIIERCPFAGSVADLLADFKGCVQ